jgi:predicted dehydrogenase
MVEKPLFAKVEHFDAKCFKKVIVGYNLRFHPLVRKLRTLLGGKRILTAQTYVGLLGSGGSGGRRSSGS